MKIPDVLVNGVKNPCCVCGRPTKNSHEISCQDLGFVHGENCNCMLIIGSDCLKKLRIKRKLGRPREMVQEPVPFHEKHINGERQNKE